MGASDFGTNSMPEIDFNKRISQVNDYLKGKGMEAEYLSNEQAVSVFNEIADSNGEVDAQDFALALAQQYDSSIKDIDDLDKNYYYALTGIAFADGDGNSFSLEDLELFQKEVEKYTKQQQAENTSATRNDKGILENTPEYFKQRNTNTASDRIKVDNNGTYYVVADAFNKNKSDNIDCYSRLITNIYGYSYDSEEGKKLMEALLEANPDLENGMQVGERINLVNAQEVLNLEPAQDNNKPVLDENKSETYNGYIEQFYQEVNNDNLHTMLLDKELSPNEKVELLSEAKTYNSELVEQYLKQDDTFYVSSFIGMTYSDNYSVDDIANFISGYNEVQGSNKSLNISDNLVGTFIESCVALFERAAQSNETDKLNNAKDVAENIRTTTCFNNAEKEMLLERLSVASGQYFTLS